MNGPQPNRCAFRDCVVEGRAAGAAAGFDNDAARDWAVVSDSVRLGGAAADFFVGYRESYLACKLKPKTCEDRQCLPVFSGAFSRSPVQSS